MTGDHIALDDDVKTVRAAKLAIQQAIGVHSSQLILLFHTGFGAEDPGMAAKVSQASEDGLIDNTVLESLLACSQKSACAAELFLLVRAPPELHPFEDALREAYAKSNTIEEEDSLNCYPKVIMIGPQHCGKTSFVTRLCTNSFEENQPCTISCHHSVRAVRHCCNNNAADRTTMPTLSIQAQVWDTAGQERYCPMAPMYYRGAAVVLLAFDISDRQSFEQVTIRWKGELDTALRYNTENLKSKKTQEKKSTVTNARSSSSSSSGGASRNLPEEEKVELAPVLVLVGCKSDLRKQLRHDADALLLRAGIGRGTKEVTTGGTGWLHGAYSSTAAYGNGMTPAEHVSAQEALAVAAGWGVPYIETSAKTGACVDLAMFAGLERAVRSHASAFPEFLRGQGERGLLGVDVPDPPALAAAAAAAAPPWYCAIS
jgi:small GTP-binding protein